MQTGENEQALRKIVDFTRFLGILVLIFHFYFSCYGAFKELHVTYTVVDKILLNIYRLPVFKSTLIVKLAAIGFLIISLIGTKGKKDEQIKLGTSITYSVLGLLLYFLSAILFKLQVSLFVVAIFYISVTSIGFLLFLTGISMMYRIINVNLSKDIFNHENETFPQEERKLENEYSINLPAKYRLKGKVRDSWINVINPFRGSLVMGTPGAGKSYFIIRHIITQHIKKGFTMFLYDFKYDDLSKIAYNTLLNNSKAYKVKPKFYVINFEDLNRSHRCNPLDPASMWDITDAMESSRTFMLGLNREWIKKQGDFFVESPINFVTALIWFLKKYEDGRYCTLPHAIELAQVDYKYLFALLKTEPEIEVLINPFISAWQNEAYDQLEGQIASAKISMARLVSPSLYYVLSGKDFSLDLNNPIDPKIICMGNNPLKQQVYGAVLSLYISRTIKLVNQKNKLKCNLIFDYGIARFAKMVEYSDLITVYRQVLYAYYRGNLPSSLLNKINYLAEEDAFIPDDDYSGFTGEGDEFNPATGIDEFKEAGELDEDFRHACIDYWQMQQAMRILQLSGGNIDTIMASAAKTQGKIDEWEKKGGRDVTVMMSTTMMFQFYQKSKSPYEIDLLRAFLSIKSILGNKELVATTKDYVLTRMTGARKKELLPEMLKKPGIKAVYETYSKRYQIDKLLSELLARGFITGKLAYNRRIYLSTHLTTADLPEAVHQLLSKNNTKIKRDRNSAVEKDAREKLKALIKAG